MGVPLEAISRQMLTSNGKLEAESFMYAQFPHTLFFCARMDRPTPPIYRGVSFLLRDPFLAIDSHALFDTKTLVIVPIRAGDGCKDFSISGA